MKTYYEDVFTPLESLIIHGGDDISERFQFLDRKGGVKAVLSNGVYPPSQKATGFKTVDECMRVPLEAYKERSGVCFGGFRPSKHVEEPWALAPGAPLEKAET